MSDQILVSRADGVYEVQLNRPEKRNALTLAMYGAIVDALNEARADDSIRVVLFSGAGAGREAAASAVLGDVVAALRAIAERHVARRISNAVRGSQAIAPAFERFPAFAGYPVLTTITKGDTHVGYSSRTLSAV